MPSVKTPVGPDVPIVPKALFNQPKLSGDARVKFKDGMASLTHLDKVFWPGEGYTKGDLLKYYFDVSRQILPYLKDRPTILKRYPNGIDQPSFYQQDVKDTQPFVETISLDAKAGHKVNYAMCNNLASLLYLANLGAIAQNPWHSRAGNLNCPDWIIFDLDPGKVDYSAVCELAVVVKEQAAELGLECYPKTSGASGMHIYVPIKAIYDYEHVATFAEQFATVVARNHSSLATLERNPAKRKPHSIYLDHLQNARVKSVAAPYSVREKPGATVSAPLDWQEVQAGKISIQDFTIKNMPARLADKGDLFKLVLTKKQRLDKAMVLLSELIGD